MAETIALSKVLQVREKEKKDAQLTHYQSMEFFEEIATQLYTVLKKKELAEETYEKSIQGVTSIDIIKEQMTYIETLNSQIMKLQSTVKQARTNMEKKQEILTDTHIEVKKYKKIIELRQVEQKKNIQKQEQMSMDEISTQQFLSRKKR